MMPESHDRGDLLDTSGPIRESASHHHSFSAGQQCHALPWQQSNGGQPVPVSCTVTMTATDHAFTVFRVASILGARI
jgi:hypothetical protein